MKTIVIASRAGGVGKTTLARNLAVVADAPDYPVMCLDMSPDKSLRRWWKRRRKVDGPAMIPRDPEPQELQAMLARIEAAKYQLCIIDTPRAGTAWSDTAIAAADLVVIPVRPMADLREVEATADIARRLQVPFAFVLNEAPKAELTQDVIVTLEKLGPVAPIALPPRVVHTIAEAAGRGVSETRDARGTAEIAALWQWLREMLYAQPTAQETDAEDEQSSNDGSFGVASRKRVERKLQLVVDQACYSRLRLYCAANDITRQDALHRAVTEFLDRVGAPSAKNQR
ncbi:plasmid partitioning protein ParA [Haematobacter missouriensis]|nr:plasmid partitioning protein ParA [Haematobacter missouriensis]